MWGKVAKEDVSNTEKKDPQGLEKKKKRNENVRV